MSFIVSVIAGVDGVLIVILNSAVLFQLIGPLIHPGLVVGQGYKNCRL